ncbi:PREDICTED: major allergen Pru ar 1-like [Nelumbo nucifera]|uniref:Major allergen Pru ar 1-like n=2 Tax=Nelumbo nucifera TaxID=4432 RepID=A0A1U8ABG2_NELNU|nr:PREDICTED: major allergen Pru ar 1-like [Nelumbo nucifera]DAD38163.1 TPA_asm: hypothetical protein HUJ06_008804 [Nelumbo nucifera]
MGVTTFTQEFASPVAPARMFKALILDSRNLIPKLMPQAIKSVDLIQGDGEVGSIEQVNFTEAIPFKYVKNRVNELDKENFVCKYSLIEGDPLKDKLDHIDYEVKFMSSSDGGCMCKMISQYHTKGDVEIKEEEIKEGKDQAKGMYKLVENYLLANPDVYA